MFGRDTDNLANAVRLLVAMGGFVATPGPKSGLAVYDAIRKVAARPPSSIATMAEDLTAAARATLAGVPNLPRDADILLVQMVESGLLSPQEIAALGMDAQACTRAMLAKLSDRTDPTGEMRAAPMRMLFDQIARPTLDRLLRSRDFAADLTPAYMAESLQTAQRADRKLDDVVARLDDLSAQTRYTLESLALRFGEPAPENLALPDLREFLVKKSRDYRALRDEVEALRGTAPRVDNVLTAVEDRIDALDFDEAERLLASVRETSAEALRKPLEDNARIMETQARLALVRGAPERAFTLLSHAADSFAALDPLEPARRRVTYARTLYDHGERFGGPVMAMAERVARAILDVADAGDGTLFAEAQNLVGLSLMSQGRYAEDARRGDLLDRAAQALTAAQSAARGYLRAAALDNLSVVRMNQAHDAPRDNRIALLRTAIEGSQQAIELFGDDPGSVARALNNLGNAHLLLARDLEGAALHEALDQAFQALDRATRMFGEIGDIVNMAGARFGVATVIERQATVLQDHGRRSRAIDEFGKARTFYRQNNMPQDAAMAAGALGSALLTHATNAPADHILPLLMQAEAALSEAAAHYRETGQPLLEVALLRKQALAEELRALSLPPEESADLLRQAHIRLRRAAGLDAAADEAQALQAALQRVEQKLAEQG